MKHALAAFAFLSLLMGCARDRTLEEYNRDKVGEQIAQIQSVSGTYRGQLHAVSDSEPLGALELEISPDARIDTTRNSSATQAQASLQGRLRLHLNGELHLLSFEDGFYDPSNGDFKASVPLTQKNGKAIPVKIAGTFANDSAEGSIQASGYKENGATFSLTRDLELAQVQSQLATMKGKQDRHREGFSATRFEGDAQWVDGATSKMSMTLLLSHATTDQEILDLFVPVKWVDLTLQMNEERVFFPNVEWNQEVHLLLGDTTSPTGDRLSIQCRMLSTSNDPWQCRYFNASGLAFQVRFARLGG